MPSEGVATGATVFGVDGFAPFDISESRPVGLFAGFGRRRIRELLHHVLHDVEQFLVVECVAGHRRVGLERVRITEEGDQPMPVDFRPGAIELRGVAVSFAVDQVTGYAPRLAKELPSAIVVTSLVLNVSEDLVLQGRLGP